MVIAPVRDSHARAVLEALRSAGVPTLRLDTSRFPERTRVAVQLDDRGRWSGGLQDGGAPLAAADVRAVWWRRPTPYALHASLRGARRTGAFCAAHAALGACWHATDARWVNAPEAEAAADDKPRQLELAARLGLAVPRSLVTNDAAAARAFVAERPAGETIHKNVTAIPALSRPTAVALASDRALFAGLRHLPLLLQERVSAAADARVTVVGGEVFAAEIALPGGEDPIDWRPRFTDAAVRAARLPRAVEDRVLRLVRALGLSYAALDLRRRHDGEHVFLEVNPSGEWLFVERATGQPITAALARLLAGGAR
jgi:glutathione synthase/RimK-type ligase-like ATP-grasp enzyme